MNLIVGTIGQLVIVELFVFYIWLKVLLDTTKARDNSLAGRKLLLTSLGLVLNALALTGIMAYRLFELVTGNWPFVLGIVVFYVVLVIGNILFILSASIGGNQRMLKAFLVTTGLWLAYVVYATWT